MGRYKTALFKLLLPVALSLPRHQWGLKRPSNAQGPRQVEPVQTTQQTTQQTTAQVAPNGTPHGSAGIGTIGDLSNPASKYSYIRRKPIPVDLRRSVITPRDALSQAKWQKVDGTYRELEPSTEINNYILSKARESQASSHANGWAAQGTAFNKLVARAMREAGEHWQRLKQRGEWDPNANAPMPDYLKNHRQYQILSPGEKALMQHQLNNMVYNNNNSTGYRHA